MSKKPRPSLAPISSAMTIKSHACVSPTRIPVKNDGAVDGRTIRPRSWPAQAKDAAHLDQFGVDAPDP